MNKNTLQLKIFEGRLMPDGKLFNKTVTIGIDGTRSGFYVNNLKVANIVKQDDSCWLSLKPENCKVIWGKDSCTFGEHDNYGKLEERGIEIWDTFGMVFIG